MNTLIFSIAGILALIAISAFFNYLEIRKNDKLAQRIASIRKAAALVPKSLLHSVRKSGIDFLPTSAKARNWKLDGLGPLGTTPAV